MNIIYVITEICNFIKTYLNYEKNIYYSIFINIINSIEIDRKKKI